MPFATHMVFAPLPTRKPDGLREGRRSRQNIFGGAGKSRAYLGPQRSVRAWPRLPRLVICSQHSPPDQPPPPARWPPDRKPQLLLKRAQVELHHIGEPPLQ